jgi:hypothetical protein
MTEESDAQAESDVEISEAASNPEDQEVTFLMSAAGFFASLIALSAVIFVFNIPEFESYIVAILWIIFWPRFCKSKEWQNMHKGAIVHRWFTVALIIVYIIFFGGLLFSLAS